MITRNNYEEYFLLYADNELSEEAKRELSVFLQQNPDLEEELAQLKTIVLAAEPTLEMPKKSELYKSIAWDNNELTSTQSQLLLYIDNELHALSIDGFEKKIAKDPLLRKELALLTQTVQKPQKLEMPDRASLYRREKNRSIIYFTVIRRFAAAAIIVGLGCFLFIKIEKNNKIAHETAGTNLPSTLQKVSKKDMLNPSDKAIAGLPGKGNINNEVLPENSNMPANRNVSSSTKSLQNNGQITKPSVENELADRHDKGESLAIISHANNGLESKNNKQEKISQHDKSIPTDSALSISSLDESATKNNIKKNAIAFNKSPELAIVSSRTNIREDGGMMFETDDSNADDEYINVIGTRIKKQKMRGIFRSVGRTMGRAFEKSSITRAEEGE